MRGLSLSIPGVKGRAAGDVVFDAESTAVGLLFLTPGILSADPTNAPGVRDRLKGLASFPALVKYLKDNLPTSTLAKLVATDQLNTLMTACTDEWTSKYSVTSTRSVSIGGGPIDQFGVSIANQTNPAATQLRLSNSAWRYVDVYRRDLRDTTEQRVAAVADGFDAMSGGVPMGWGSVFTGRVGNSTTKTDTVNYGSGGATTSEYWVFGPGFAGGSETAPTSLAAKSAAIDAWGISTVYYLAFPIIDIIAGLSQGTSAGLKVAKTVWASVKGGISLTKLFSATDWRAVASALIDVTVSIIKITITTGVLVGAGWLSADAAAVIGVILAVPSVFFAAANCGICAKSWCTTKRKFHISVTNTGGAAVVVN